LVVANARPGEHIIDVGCGTGATTAELARAVGPTGHVLGVDISETLIEAARSHRVDNATFVLGDAATHPFKAGTYDLVFSSGMLHLNSRYRDIVRSAYAQARRLLLCDFRLTYGPDVTGRFHVNFDGEPGQAPRPWQGWLPAPSPRAERVVPRDGV
jgi:SAM-dependent methyltransferase